MNPQLKTIADQVWDSLYKTSLLTAFLKGEPIREFPDMSPEKLEADAAQAKAFVQQLDQLDRAALEDSDKVLLDAMRFELNVASQGARFDDYRFDITPYSGGNALVFLPNVTASAQLDSAEGREAYLESVQSFARSCLLYTSPSPRDS